MLLVAPASWGADEQQIQRAIARGLDASQRQTRSGSGDLAFLRNLCGASQDGATALAGVTLLECGVPSDDPVVKKAASAVRQASVSLIQTYELSTAILFLDRLGDPGDVGLIQSMAVRLLGGQTSTGGWSYDCPPPSRSEVAQELTAHLRKPGEAKPIAKVLPGRPAYAAPGNSSTVESGRSGWIRSDLERQLQHKVCDFGLWGWPAAMEFRSKNRFGWSKPGFAQARTRMVVGAMSPAATV